MDAGSPERKVAEESARESLIAISQSTPAEAPAAAHLSPEHPPGGGGAGVGEEEYRTRLISISDSKSPDAKASPLPPSPENLHT
ncbi:unnamed protein product [Spirodela intermedia]|uniref:Uncharacterized protein n=1 Tax=Spirodela intermedia TaxID=51605 RepID=A0A7I8LN18_SPIIN|nr:unnamed protein product [Spirodela intermedia]